MTDFNPLHVIGALNREIGNSTASVLEFLGITDQLVDPDGIRSVARSWQDLADALDDQVAGSYSAVLDVRWAGDTPAAITGRVEQARTRATSVAAQLHGGAQQLRSFADTAREAIVEIGVIAAEIIEWEAVGLALDVLTAGLATCAATVAAGARALKILALVERIGEAGVALLRTVDELAASVRGLGAALRALRAVARAGLRGAVDAVGIDSIDLATGTGRVRGASDVSRDALWGAAGGVALEGLTSGGRGLTPVARAAVERIAAGIGDDAGSVSLELLLPYGQLSRLLALVRREGDRSGKLFSPEERAALDEYRARLAKEHPEDFSAFRKDPDKKGIDDEEAMTGLHLRDSGSLPLDLRRPTVPDSGDFIGTENGVEVHYDIKAFRDSWPTQSGRSPDEPFPEKAGGFTVGAFTRSLEEQFLSGRKVVLDVQNLKPETVDAMIETVAEKGWGERVVWYP